MKETAQCQKCGKPFEYEWRARVHRVCEACKVKVRRAAVRRCTKQAREALSGIKTPYAKTLDSPKVVFQRDNVSYRRLSNLGVRIEVLDAVAAMTRNQVATALGMTYESVRAAEERGLLKLRSHPELMRRWLQYRQNGGGVPLREDPGERLLEYQLQIAKWYRLAERLGEAGCEEERQACIQLIQKFQHKLGGALRESEPAI